MHDKTSFIGFNERLKELLKEKKITQVEASQRIGISKHTLTKYLNGERIPETSILLAMAKFFDKPMEWFLEGRENKTPKLAGPTPGNMSVAGENRKKAASHDLNLEQMCSVLKKLMQSEDPNMRGWTIVQFKKAFGEHCNNTEETGSNYPGYTIDRKY